MDRIKKSTWAMTVFILTVISTVMFVVALITFFTGMGAVRQSLYEAAKQADSKATEETLQATVNIAMGITIGIAAIGWILSGLVLLGGYLFSLKGRWAMFCIVMAIISAVAAVFSFIGVFTSGAINVPNLVSNFISLALNVVMAVACIKLRIEDKKE